MHTDAVEAAYCKERIERSNELVLAATNICARLAHEEMSSHYQHRLAALIIPVKPLLGWLPHEVRRGPRSLSKRQA